MLEAEKASFLDLTMVRQQGHQQARPAKKLEKDQLVGHLNSFSSDSMLGSLQAVLERCPN